VRAIAICVLFAACGPPPSASDTLTDTVRGYNEAIRWERFENAAIALPQKERAQTVDDWDERAHDLKITDVDIVKIDGKGPHEARAQIKLKWFKNSEGTLRETQSIQTWEKKNGKSWELVDERRLRGHEMPGLAEPIDKDEDKDKDKDKSDAPKAREKTEQEGKETDSPRKPSSE
jgi:hypothetical protein